MKLHRRAEIMQGRADIQNLSLVLFQFFERGPTDDEGSFEIDVDDGAETIRRKFFRRAKKIPGGAVDDDIDLSEALDGGGDGFLNIVRFANVGRDREGFA